MNKILCLITARGGSKRVPRKNIREFCGKPLLAWTVEAAKESGVFDRIILSTEDAEIAEIGRRAGAEVSFMRPNELASDTAGSFEVVKQAVGWFKENENYEAPWIVLLEPSSPGRQAFHLKEVAAFIEKDLPFDSILSISEAPAHFSPAKILELGASGEVTRYGDHELIKNLTHRNQDVAKAYYINSALYAFRTKNIFEASPSLWGQSTYGYLMDNKYSMDIDTLDDWAVAEAKMKQLLNK